MTDRIKGLTITLESNIRDDDAINIVNAIMMIKGVLDVTQHISDANHIFAVETAKCEMRKQFQNILYPQGSE